MATRIELPKELVADSFETRVQSLKRAINAASNKLVKEALTSELAQITAAIASMTEIK